MHSISRTLEGEIKSSFIHLNKFSSTLWKTKKVQIIHLVFHTYSISSFYFMLKEPKLLGHAINNVAIIKAKLLGREKFRPFELPNFRIVAEVGERCKRGR
jgi:hypothetical protein